MAGNYPDVPSWRMPYDRDGTQVFHASSTLGSLTQLSAGQVTGFNDESPGGTSIGRYGLGGQNAYMIVFFPELRDLDGFFIDGSSQYANPNQFRIQVSADTTNGVDGTWTTIASVHNGTTPASAAQMRTGITSTTSLGIRAVRIQSLGSYSEFSLLHLYGEAIPGANPDRLALWHPTLNQRVDPAHFDWGDSPRGSTADKQFRVKNLSASKTATSVRVALEALTDGSPSVPGQHTLSYDGGSFLAQVNVGDLAPGALSAPVTMRRATASNAALSLFWFRVFADATAWTG